MANGPSSAVDASVADAETVIDVAAPVASNPLGTLSASEYGPVTGVSRKSVKPSG